MSRGILPMIFFDLCFIFLVFTLHVYFSRVLYWLRKVILMQWTHLLPHDSIGSPFWIVRELCAVVFYSLGDGNCPFLINVIAVFMNGILDWLSLSVFGLGAQGLALSTSFVSAFSVLALLLLLSKKLGGIINIREMRGPFLLLLICCAISGFTTMLSYRMLQFFLSTISISRLTEFLSILLAGILGMSAFYLPLVFVQFPGVFLVDSLLKTLLNR